MSPRSDDARDAWRRYTSIGAIDPVLLRPSTLRAWERSHALRANPYRARAEGLSPAETAHLLEAEGELIAAARPYLAALSRAAGAERHAAMLSDRRAVVLAVMGDEASVHGPERVPGPGELCSEEVCGANGLGTPLAEGDYAELVAAEHFIEGFHPFTCQGIPLRDAEETLVGIVSTSVRRPLASQRLRDILVCAARGVEAELLRRRMEHQIERVIGARSGDLLPLEELRQDVVQAHAAARAKIETAARLFAQDRFAYALRLLETAQELVRRFELRARLWTSLASDETGAPEPVRLDDLTTRLVDLLDTEASTRRVELTASCEEPVLVEADVRGLARTLLGALLRALRAAGEGGAVTVGVRRSPGASAGEVLITPLPAAGVPAAPQDVIPLVIPCPMPPIPRVDEAEPRARSAGSEIPPT